MLASVSDKASSKAVSVASTLDDAAYWNGIMPIRR